MTTVFVENLKDGAHEEIDLTLPSSFLDLKENDLRPAQPILVKGKAYCLDGLLLLSLDASTTIEIPCSMCNEPTPIPLRNSNINLTFTLSDSPSLVIDYADALRQELLVLIPQFIECQNGACPERKNLEKYLTKPSQHFPFKHL